MKRWSFSFFRPQINTSFPGNDLFYSGVSVNIRNRNTVKFLGVWEKVYNPDFNYGEFDIIKSQAGLNSYRLSAKEWVKTNAIGILSKAGRYGGTYAHKDIAFEFAMWISPEFYTDAIKQNLIPKELAQIQASLYKYVYLCSN